jgi:hypothetical protein
MKLLTYPMFFMPHITGKLCMYLAVFFGSGSLLTTCLMLGLMVKILFLESPLIALKKHDYHHVNSFT